MPVFLSFEVTSVNAPYTFNWLKMLLKNMHSDWSKIVYVFCSFRVTEVKFNYISFCLKIHIETAFFSLFCYSFTKMENRLPNEFKSRHVWVTFQKI